MMWIETQIDKLHHLMEKYGDEEHVSVLKDTIDILKSICWVSCDDKIPPAEDMYKPPKSRYLCKRIVNGMEQVIVCARLTDGKSMTFWDWYGKPIKDEEIKYWREI